MQHLFPRHQNPSLPHQLRNPSYTSIGETVGMPTNPIQHKPYWKRKCNKNQGPSVSIMITFGSLHNNPMPNMQNIWANIFSSHVRSQLQFGAAMKRLRGFGLGLLSCGGSCNLPKWCSSLSPNIRTEVKSTMNYTLVYFSHNNGCL